MAAPSRFSSPPASSGLSPDSLRGEAVAYLASGYLRLSGAAGALWRDAGGAIARAPRVFGRPVPTTPALDAYRIGLLGWLRTGRETAAPRLPLDPGASPPAAFRDLGEVDWPAVRLVGGSYRPLYGLPAALPPSGPAAPSWGASHRVAETLRDAAEGGWLAEGSPAPAPPEGTEPFVPYAGGPSESELLCLAAFMSAASSVQPSGDPDAWAASALPPDPSDPDPPPPPRLSADGVSAMFLPDGADDPAAMARCWVLGASAAVDQASPASFTYAKVAKSDYVVKTPEEMDALRDSFDALYDPDETCFYYEEDGVQYLVSRDAAFGAWWPGGGSVRRGAAFETVRVTAPGRGWWLVPGKTRTEADSEHEYPAYEAVSVVLPGHDSWMLFAQPVNVRWKSGAPYWEYVPGADASAFDVRYAGGFPDPSTGDLPGVPRAGVPGTGGPFVLAGPAVPAASDDDVAAQFVFSATVTLYEVVVGDVESAGGVRAAGGQPSPDEWRGSFGDVLRTRRWRVAGPVPGYGRWTREAGSEDGVFDGPCTSAFSTPDEMAAFVEQVVLPATGEDFSALLRGSASYSRAQDRDRSHDRSSIPVHDCGTGESLGSFPVLATAVSGDMVVDAVLYVVVDVGAACLYESGYCA